MSDRFDTQWLDSIETFAQLDPKTRKILLLLCDAEYEWRSEGNLAKQSGMSRPEVARILDGLRRDRLIRLSLSKKKKVIYGLVSRIGS